MNNRLWILGADDPEMSATEKLLVAAGESIAYAVASDGNRVHPGNAYRSVAFRLLVPIVLDDGSRIDDEGQDASVPPISASDFTVFIGQIITVECGGDWKMADESLEVIKIDHHNPGDPGYGKPPAEFLSASSIGQVFSLLNVHNRGRYACLPLDKYSGPDGGVKTLTVHPGQYALCRGISMLADPEAECWMLRTTSMSFGQLEWIEVPQDIVMTAAADHCLAATYRGECPGVDPDELMLWRAEVKAQHRYAKSCPRCGGNAGCIGEYDDVDNCHASVTLDECRESVMAEIEAARTTLRERQSVQATLPTDTRHGFTMIDLPMLVDMREQPMPELPEAAVREGLAYLATVTDRDGRVKDVLGGHTTPEMVSQWMADRRAEGRETYGDPARGFAGSYQK